MSNIQKLFITFLFQFCTANIVAYTKFTRKKIQNFGLTYHNKQTSIAKCVFQPYKTSHRRSFCPFFSLFLDQVNSFTRVSFNTTSWHHFSTPFPFRERERKGEGRERIKAALNSRHFKYVYIYLFILQKLNTTALIKHRVKKE